MKKTLTFLLALFAVTFSATAMAPLGWTDDYASAQKKAQTEKKLVLLDFTGSDWCGWCMKLDKEVFATQAFRDYARENLILVQLDFPHRKTLTQQVKTQNAELQKKFNAHGYPTIVILDGEGKEVARWGGYSAHFFDELKAKVAAAKR